jgi:hypothetical protein
MIINVNTSSKMIGISMNKKMKSFLVFCGLLLGIVAVFSLTGYLYINQEIKKENSERVVEEKLDKQYEKEAKKLAIQKYGAGGFGKVENMDEHIGGIYTVTLVNESISLPIYTERDSEDRIAVVAIDYQGYKSAGYSYRSKAKYMRTSTKVISFSDLKKYKGLSRDKRAEANPSKKVLVNLNTGEVREDN